MEKKAKSKISSVKLKKIPLLIIHELELEKEIYGEIESPI